MDDTAPDVVGNETITNSLDCQECSTALSGSWSCCWECDGAVATYDLCSACAVQHSHPLRPVSQHIAKKVVSKSLGEYLNESFLHFGNRKCLGTKTKPGATSFEWISFADVYQISQNICSFLQSHLSPSSFIGISGKSSIPWVCVDVASMFGAFVTCGVDFTLDQKALESVMSKAKVPLVFVDPEIVDSLLVSNLPDLEFLVIMDGDFTPTQKEQLKAKNIQFYTFEEILDRGKKQPFKLTAQEGLLCILYSSGSTGIPKGIPLDSGKIVHIFEQIDLDNTLHSSLSSSRSLSFTGARMRIWIALRDGTRTALSLNVKDLLVELQEVNPTNISLASRVYNRVFTEYEQKLAIEQLKNPKRSFEEIEADVKQQFKHIFGSRLSSIGIGGSPLSPKVTQWLKDVFGVVTNESYGATETGPIATNGIVNPGREIRLEDVPELCYFSSDKPLPRGLLWVKSSFSSGYFLDTEASAETFSSGWVTTGDIVEYDEPNRAITIIDRKKSIFKLAQGEFIAPEKLEVAFLENPLFDNIFISGNSLYEYVIAVVLLNENQVKKIVEASEDEELKKKGFKEQCKDPLLNRAVLEALQEEGKKKNFKGWEIPKIAFVETDSWTEENGLLTFSHKLSRGNLARKYKPIIEELYQSRQEIDKSLRLKKGLVSFLQTKFPSLTSTGSLVESGIDSISALQVKLALEKDFNLDIPASILFAPNMSVEELADMLLKENLPLHQVDWDSEATLPNDLKAKIIEIINLPVPHFDSPQILLTGATGLLGSSILEYLVESSDSHVYCLVRVPDTVEKSAREEKARERLVSSLTYYKVWSRISSHESRIHVVVGDLSLPCLGLDSDEWDSLSNKISIVYHNGAHINSVLPYHLLKASNVGSTLEVIRLASTCFPKPVVFVSTLSVVSRNVPNRDETIKLDTSWTQYMNAYGSSKLVAELILEQAKKVGLKCSIFRPATISGHSSTGASHLGQFQNRYLQSIIKTKCSPDGDFLLDMAPCDFVARAICKLAHNYGQTYHLLNVRKCFLVNQVSEVFTKLGYPVEVVDWATWKSKMAVLCSEPSGGIFAPVFAGFSSASSPSLDQYTHDKTLQDLQEKDEVLPQITPEYLEKVIQFFQEHKAI